MLWMLVPLALALTALACVQRWLRHEDFEKIPGPKGIFFIENALDFLMDSAQLFDYFRTMASKYKYFFKLKLGPKKVIIIYNPEDIEAVISGTKNTKKGFLYRFLKPWLQEGMLLSDGAKWQHRRKILTPAFHFNILRHFSSVLEENTKILVEQLRSEVGKPKTNISAYVSDFALTSICETAMGTKLDRETTDFGKRYKEGIHTLGQLIVHRAQRVWMYPSSLFSFTNAGRKQKELLHLLSSFRDSVVNQRRETNNNQYISIAQNCDDDDDFVYKKKKLAMLDLLLQAEKQGIIDAKGIGEEVDTFMFEGHDTTATALQFAFMLIANNQKSQVCFVESAKWQHRRKILTPAFHFNILRHFSSVLEENTKILVEQLRSEVGKPKTNISAYVSDFALTSICETAMGTKLDRETTDFGKRYKEGIHTLGQLIVHRAQRVWMYPSSLFSFTNAGRKQKELLHLLSSFRDSVVNQRRETNNNQYISIAQNCDDDDDFVYKKKKLAMLDLLLQAEKQGIIDAKGIGEEVDTFMFEGHDTTATALQFAFMLIANNQKSQDKIVEECEQIFGSSTRAATMSDLGQMKYLDCCIKESLRLYPPVAFIMRQIDHPLRLKNFDIPTGIDCAILIYDLHRRSDQFPEPLEFRPERFFTEKPTWHPYGYLPFSAGPRNCIGQKFAMMEMKLALSAVLRRYRLLPVTRPQDLVFIVDFILRPKDPIYVQFEKRD